MIKSIYIIFTILRIYGIQRKLENIWYGAFPQLKRTPKPSQTKPEQKKKMGVGGSAILSCYHQHWHFRSQLCWARCSETLLCLKVVVLKANFTFGFPSNALLRGKAEVLCPWAPAWPGCCMFGQMYITPYCVIQMPLGYSLTVLKYQA